MSWCVSTKITSTLKWLSLLFFWHKLVLHFRWHHLLWGLLLYRAPLRLICLTASSYLTINKSTCFIIKCLPWLLQVYTRCPSINTGTFVDSSLVYSSSLVLVLPDTSDLHIALWKGTFSTHLVDSSLVWSSSLVVFLPPTNDLPIALRRGTLSTHNPHLVYNFLSYHHLSSPPTFSTFSSISIPKITREVCSHLTNNRWWLFFTQM